MPSDREGEALQAKERFGWKALVLTLMLHATALVIATYPTVLTLGSTLPGGGDVLQHIWVMRWFRACLIKGESFYRCPQLQHPTGAPLGNYS